MTKAYISATFEDLKDCRLAVQQALSQLDMGYRTMEVYVAESRAPLERCLDDIDACDIYIGIFAWRYGYKPPGETKSITHLEYEHAAAKGKHCLIFLLDKEAPWPVKFVDRNQDAAHVDELRDLLAREYLCSFFNSPERLAVQVIAAVSKYHPGPTAEPAQAPAEDGPGLSTLSRKQYFERLQQQYGGLDLDALSQQQAEGEPGARLAAVFVEPSVREDQRPELPRELWHRFEETGQVDQADLPDDLDVGELTRFYTTYRDKPLRPVFDVLCAPANNRVVLLGDPGSGKSAAVRYLAVGLTGAHRDASLEPLRNHLPILIEMRGYAAVSADGRSRSILDYLEHRAATDGYRREPQALHNHLANGDRTVVIFDGLDEIFEVRRREEAAEQIAAFAADFPAARIIVTSRLPEYPRRILGGAGFAHYTLHDLDPASTVEFLDRWYQVALPDQPGEVAVRRDLVSGAIRQSPALTELAGNPMLLSILAIIGRHRMLPRQRWRLYEHAASVLVERWDTNRLLHDSTDGPRFIDAEDKRELLRRLAFDMQTGRAGPSRNFVDSEQLKQIFTDYLIEHFGLDPAAARADATPLINQLRERNFILSRYGPHVYGFQHRTFLEFFCAWAILRKFQHTHEWTFEHIQATFRDHWADPSWGEVLRLLAGDLYAPRTAELVEFLATGADPDWPPPVDPISPDAGAEADPPWHIALAVQCLAETRPVSQAARAAGLVLQQIMVLIDHCATVYTPRTVAMLGDEVLPAVDAIGPAWPGRQAYLSWYRTQAAELVVNPAGSYAARIAAMLAGDADRLDVFLTGLLDSADDVRVVCAAVAGLGEVIRQASRRDPAPDTTEALSRLAEAAASDERAVVRLSAVQALGAVAGADQEIHDVLLGATDDGNDEVRLMAVEALGERFRLSPESAEVLLAILRNDRHAPVRQAALRTLIGDRRLSPEIEEALLAAVRADTDADVVELAADALLVRPAVAEQVRTALRGRLTTDPDRGVRRAAIRLLGREGHETELLDRITADRHGMVIREAAMTLAARRGDLRTQVCTALIERLDADPDEVIRRAVIRILSDTCADDPRTEATLMESAAHDRDQPVRLAAVTALATRPPAERRRTVFIGVMAGDAAPAVRLIAVQALAQYRDGTATAALAGIMLSDPDVPVRVAAIRGLTGRRLGAAVGRRLVDLTDSGHPPTVRLAAIEVLVASRPRGVDLAEVFHDRSIKDPVSEVFAAAAVAAVSDPGWSERLWPVIAGRAVADPNPRIRAAAVELLGSASGFADAAAVLTGRLRDDVDPAVVQAAARAAGGLSPLDARAMLLARLDTPDVEMRCAVIRSLAVWVPADAGVRAVILAQTRDPKEIDVRRAAVQALAAAAGLPDVRQALAELREDADWSVRSTATRILRTPPYAT